MKRLMMGAATIFLSTTLWSMEPTFPAGSNGAVTLDWTKFNEIWTKMQQLEKQVTDLQNPEHLPPVPYTITRAAYKGRVFNHRVEVEALYDVNVFAAKDWVKIPFLPSSVAVREAQIDGQSAGVVEDGQFHQLVLKGAGRHVLKTRFWLKAPEGDQAPHLQLNIPSTAITLLSLQFPKKDLEVTIEPSQGFERQTNAEGTLVTAAIPPTSAVDVRWQKAVPEEANGPAKIYAESEQLLTVSEGSVHAHWNLNYNVLHRGVRQLRIQMPAGWNVTSITGEGLQEWKILDRPKEGIALIEMAYAKKGALTIAIDAERGLGEKEEVLEIPQIQPLDVERVQGSIGVEARGAMEIQPQDAKSLSPIDPQELPRTLWAGAAQPILLAYRHTKPYHLAVSVTRHPEAPVLTTTVDDANAVTLMTARGQMITDIRYQVRNHLKQFLKLRLPPGAELWSTFVDGQPVKPMQVEPGQFRIPLAKSQMDGSLQQGFPVEVVYFMPVPKFYVAGARAAIFPVPDAPVSRLYWSMYLPDHYRFVRFGGDFEKSPQAASLLSAVVGARVDKKDFINEEEQKGGFFKRYAAKAARMRDIKELSQAMGAYSTESLPAAAPALVGASRQVAMESDVLLNRNEATRAGVFPVAFQVPSSGQLFRFGQVMIVNENPRLSLWFVHERIVTGLIFLVVGLLLTLAYRKSDVLKAMLLQTIHRIRQLASHPTLMLSSHP